MCLCTYNRHPHPTFRWMGLCAAGLLLLDIWAWVAPGVLAPKGTVRRASLASLKPTHRIINHSHPSES